LVGIECSTKHTSRVRIHLCTETRKKPIHKWSDCEKRLVVGFILRGGEIDESRMISLVSLLLVCLPFLSLL
jgi:hypothetical protein